MGERMAEMIRFVQQQIMIRLNDNPKQNPYEKPIETKEFLADYRVRYKVGLYASLRYFEDFKTIGYFHVEGEEFLINYEKIRFNPYGIKFPEPNKKQQLKEKPIPSK